MKPRELSSFLVDHISTTYFEWRNLAGRSRIVILSGRLYILNDGIRPAIRELLSFLVDYIFWMTEFGRPFEVRNGSPNIQKRRSTLSRSLLSARHWLWLSHLSKDNSMSLFKNPKRALSSKLFVPDGTAPIDLRLMILISPSQPMKKWFSGDRVDFGLRSEPILLWSRFQQSPWWCGGSWPKVIVFRSFLNACQDLFEGLSEDTYQGPRFCQEGNEKGNWLPSKTCLLVQPQIAPHPRKWFPAPMAFSCVTSFQTFKNTLTDPLIMQPQFPFLMVSSPNQPVWTRSEFHVFMFLLSD
jgi:hypothetical protein